MVVKWDRMNDAKIVDITAATRNFTLHFTDVWQTGKLETLGLRHWKRHSSSITHSTRLISPVGYVKQCLVWVGMHAREACVVLTGCNPPRGAMQVSAYFDIH